MTGTVISDILLMRVLQRWEASRRMAYKVDGDTLTVHGDLTGVIDLEFDVFASELLEAEATVLTIDLMGVTMMGSAHIGILSAFASKVHERGRRLRVVATGNVAKLLKETGVDQLLELAVY